jgi:phosphotriesterase-related protein
MVVSGLGEQAAKIHDNGAYVVHNHPEDVLALATAGHAERVLLTTGGAGLAFGHDAPAAAYAPLVTALPDDLAHQVLVANPRDLLTVKER